MADNYKSKLDALLRDQRNLVKRVGELERTQTVTRKRPEDEYWGEEAGRRFVEQQEQLVALKEENAALKQLMESGEQLLGCELVILGLLASAVTAVFALRQRHARPFAATTTHQCRPQRHLPAGKNSRSRAHRWPHRAVQGI